MEIGDVVVVDKIVTFLVVMVVKIFLRTSFLVGVSWRLGLSVNCIVPNMRKLSDSLTKVGNKKFVHELRHACHLYREIDRLIDIFV